MKTLARLVTIGGMVWTLLGGVGVIVGDPMGLEVVVQGLMVTVSGLDKGTLVYGVGFAKRSFDAPRIERGTSIALDRAIDDLIRKMAVQLYNGNRSAA